MPRRITVGKTGSTVLGQLSSRENTLISVKADDDINLEPNGNGEIVCESHVKIDNGHSLKLAEDDGNSSVILTAPSSLSADVTYTLPGSGVTDGFALITDGSGNLSWTDLSLVIANDTTSGGTFYPMFVSSTSGAINTANVSSGKLSYVPQTGTLTSTVLVESSSITLKENLNPITNALDKVLSLNAFTYDRKDGSQSNEAGLIAEEVNDIIPNVVSKDADGNPDGINYTRLTAYLIESVKELKQQLDSMQKA